MKINVHGREAARLTASLLQPGCQDTGLPAKRKKDRFGQVRFGELTKVTWTAHSLNLQQSKIIISWHLKTEQRLITNVFLKLQIYLNSCFEC